MTVRVVIVDDQGMVGTGFGVLLNARPDIEVVGEAVNGEEGLRRIAELRPDVVLMDAQPRRHRAPRVRPGDVRPRPGGARRGRLDAVRPERPHHRDRCRRGPGLPRGATVATAGTLLALGSLAGSHTAPTGPLRVAERLVRLPFPALVPAGVHALAHRFERPAARPDGVRANPAASPRISTRIS